MEALLKEMLAKLERLENDIAQIKAQVQKLSAGQREPEKRSRRRLLWIATSWMQVEIHIFRRIRSSILENQLT
ncbi:hypothetical protein HYR99_28205 [Candidatus Poribacteria bacterium]|nr:hypothetical protein [Candidatus Poribacteria bacterium]